MAALLVGIGVGAATWSVLRRGHGRRSADDTEPAPVDDRADPKLQRLLAQIDADLRVPSIEKPVPLDLLLEHDAAFVSQQSPRVEKELDAARQRAEPKRVSSAYATAVQREVVALERERRSLGRLADYADADERARRIEAYKKARIEVFHATRERERTAVDRTRSSSRPGSRDDVRQLRELKRLDRLHAETWAESLSREIALADALRLRVDYRDPLYMLFNEEIRALRRARTAVERSPRYRGLRDRHTRMTACFEAVASAEGKQAARLEETLRRLTTEAERYWDRDLLVAALRREIVEAGEAKEYNSPAEALSGLASQAHRRLNLAEAFHRYCAAMAQSATGAPAEAFRECASAWGEETRMLKEISGAGDNL